MLLVQYKSKWRKLVCLQRGRALLVPPCCRGGWHACEGPGGTPGPYFWVLFCYVSPGLA